VPRTLRHPFSVDHVTLMVRHVYSERVTFMTAMARSRPGHPASRRRHSDGLQVVRVETARGPVVLASDARIITAYAAQDPFPISIISAT